MADNNITTCIYNDGVDCDTANCARCGWNPAVAAKRERADKIARFQAKFPDQKLYRIPFTGYCEVWARTPEDAVEIAGNDDMFFVHYEFGEAERLPKEDMNELD